MEGSIHGLPEYQNFHYTFTFSTILACLPSLYMPPTVAVMLKIVTTYWNSKTPPMDRHIFICISLNFVCSLLFYSFDFFRISLPSTGIFTSWCASIEPNHYFKLIFLFTFFFNYCILLLPFFLSLIRVVILLRPRDHAYICPRIMTVILPLLFFVPFGCTAFMIPAMGYCRSMGDPLKFGAVYIYYHGGWTGVGQGIIPENWPSLQWRNSYIHLTMSVTMCVLTLCSTGLMIFKLKETTMDANVSTQTKKSSTRAERSLTITIIASMIPFVNNTVLTIIYLTIPDLVFYFIVIRPFGNDIETCMMPWILYLTHPMFKNHGRRSSTTSSVSVVLSKQLTV